MKFEFVLWYDIYFWTDSLACEEALWICARSWARQANVRSARGLALSSPDFRLISPHRLTEIFLQAEKPLPAALLPRACSQPIATESFKPKSNKKRNEWWCNLICLLNTFILVKKSHDCTDCSMVMWSQCWVKKLQHVDRRLLRRFRTKKVNEKNRMK